MDKDELLRMLRVLVFAFDAERVAHQATRDKLLCEMAKNHKIAESLHAKYKKDIWHWKTEAAKKK